MKPTLEQLSTALDRAVRMGYYCYISVASYGGEANYSCNLHQDSIGGASMKVQGGGKTLNEAVEKCFANFPENPLDGTGWRNNRLSPPTPFKETPIDGEFTEVPKE